MSNVMPPPSGPPPPNAGGPVGPPTPAPGVEELDFTYTVNVTGAVNTSGTFDGPERATDYALVGLRHAAHEARQQGGPAPQTAVATITQHATIRQHGKPPPTPTPGPPSGPVVGPPPPFPR